MGKGAVWWFSICFAEFVTSFGLLTVATASGIKVTDGVVNPWSAVPAGCIVAILAYSFGSVSGAHFNPGVSLAFWLRAGKNKFSLIELLVYLPFQFAGAILGALFTLYQWGEVKPMYPYVDAPSWGQLACAEIFWTTMLITVIFSQGTTKDKAGHYGPFAIGCLVAVAGMSSCSANCLNPIVAVGISLAHMAWLKKTNAPSWKYTVCGKAMAFYIFVPLIGILTGMLCFRMSRIVELGFTDLKPFIKVVQDEPPPVDDELYAKKKIAVDDM
eukprot:Platyproteum_vivax@DN3894_c0_g1_i1.p1